MMHATPTLRLITLDLDDTLWPCAPVIQQAEEAVYEWLATETPRIVAEHDVVSLRHHRLAVAEQHPEIAHDLTRLRLSSLRQLLKQHGYAASRAEEVMAVFHAARNAVTPFPEVVDTLRSLRRHYRLVAITNGNADISRTPLHDCVHAALTAADVGAQKPDPALFLAALAHAGVDAAAAVHVGDDPHLDVEAARQLGMATVWINRARQPWPDELAAPDLECTDLAGLLNWLNPVA